MFIDRTIQFTTFRNPKKKTEKKQIALNTCCCCYRGVTNDDNIGR